MPLLGSTRGTKGPVFVWLDEYQGARICNIRKVYYDQAQGEYVPTRKGIALTGDKLADVFKILTDNIGCVREWFGWGHNGTSQDSISALVAEDMERQSDSAERKSGSKRWVRQDEFADSRFSFPYSFEDECARETIARNASHPFHHEIDRVLSSDEPVSRIRSEIEGLVSLTFLAYKHAHESLRTDQASVRREDFEAEWDRLLRMYVRGGRHKGPKDV